MGFDRTGFDRTRIKKQVLSSALKSIGNKDLFHDLLAISWPQLQAILINLFAKRIERLSPHDVLRQYKQNRFVQPSAIDQRVFNIVDSAFFKNISENDEVIELSTLAPIGSNSVLATIHQNNIISTVRNVEVMADAVTTLALECAKRRQDGEADPITLYTSQREVRAQKYTEESGFLPHFRGVSIVSSYIFDGKDLSLANMLKKHIEFYLYGLREAVALIDGLQVKNITVEISSMRLLYVLIRKLNLDVEYVKKNARNKNFKLLEKTCLPNIIDVNETLNEDLTKKYRITRIINYVQRISKFATGKLQREFPDVSFIIRLDRTAGMGYYKDITYEITAENKYGVRFQLASGGEVDWTRLLLQSKKERCIAGGMGTELLLTQFINK